MPMRRSKPFPRTLIRAPVAVRFFVGFTESVVSSLLVTLVGTDAALTEVVEFIYEQRMKHAFVRISIGEWLTTLGLCAPHVYSI